jgi:hypothetical protein
MVAMLCRSAAVSVGWRARCRCGGSVAITGLIVMAGRYPSSGFVPRQVVDDPWYSAPAGVRYWSAVVVIARLVILARVY